MKIEGNYVSVRVGEVWGEKSIMRQWGVERYSYIVHYDGEDWIFGEKNIDDMITALQELKEIEIEHAP